MKQIIKGDICIAVRTFGKNNEYLGHIILLALHKIKKVNQIWINNIPIEDKKFKGLYQVQYSTGNKCTQTKKILQRIPFLARSDSPNHTFNALIDKPLLYIRLKENRKLWRKIPKIEVEIEY